MNNHFVVIHIHELAVGLLFTFMSSVLAHYSTLFKLFMNSLDGRFDALLAHVRKRPGRKKEVFLALFSAR